jgi:hypothetical protein
MGSAETGFGFLDMVRSVAAEKSDEVGGSGLMARPT